jgi:HAD superfamily hydrolase (TIGR01509 family)
MKIAVASAADMVKVKANLKCIGVDADLFDALVTGDDVTRNKPDPEIFQKAAKKLGVNPEDCIVIEDAISGLQAARKAGMTSIGVTSAFSREEIAQGDPDHVVDSLEEAFHVIFD